MSITTKMQWTIRWPQPEQELNAEALNHLAEQCYRQAQKVDESARKYWLQAAAAFIQRKDELKEADNGADWF